MASSSGMSGVGVAVTVAGGFLVFAAVKDFSPLSGLRAIVAGQSPTTVALAKTSGLQNEAPAIQAILEGTSSAAGTPGAPATSTGSAIADDALKYQGTPYRYGGATPQAGFDCSGLIYYVLGHDLGIKGVPRTIGAQNLWPGATTIGASQAQPGDLVLWPYGVGPDAHGGIVVGAGEYVNAPYTGTVVRVDPIPSTLHGGPPVYRRVLT